MLRFEGQADYHYVVIYHQVLSTISDKCE